jgi:class 3 adenylate cyclase
MNAPADIPVVDEPVDECRQEADVVDTQTVSGRRATSVGPAVVDAVRIDHDESQLVGDPVVVRQRGLRASALSGPVQVDDQASRMIQAGRNVQFVGPLYAPEGQLAP